jgi:O-antigen ligase
LARSFSAAELRPWLRRAAILGTTFLPLDMLHFRAWAEGVAAFVNLCFLADSAMTWDWAWTRAPWVRLAGLLWFWQLACSMPWRAAAGWHATLEALAAASFLLLPASLGCFALASPSTRRWFRWLLSAAALYIAAACWFQLATGANFWGEPRSPFGELTGPFLHPEAAAPLSRLLFPLALGAGLAPFGTALLLAAGTATIVVIGQRMPLLLTLLGLAVTALVQRRLRWLIAGVAAAGLLLVAVTPVLLPATWHRLGTQFSAQMRNFPDSAYGQLFGRALVIAADSPWMGRGFDGFRYACTDPATFRALPALGQTLPDGGGVGACNLHPHNHYLEALTNAGIPGLLLFTALVAAWLLAIGRGIARGDAKLRWGLFIAVLIQEWPLASTSSFWDQQIGGIFLLLLGWGLAEARA